jgi:integrase
VPKSLPKSVSSEGVAELVAAIDADQETSSRRNSWPERDRAIVFTSLLAGLRADELISAKTGDTRRTDDSVCCRCAAKAIRTVAYPWAPNCSMSSTTICSRGTLQYRILRAFKKAGINGERSPGALVHGLRHTFATELANANISVYTLMKLLGHESMVTSQRYVDGAGTDTRSATEQNPLYRLLADDA